MGEKIRLLLLLKYICLLQNVQWVHPGPLVIVAAEYNRKIISQKALFVYIFIKRFFPTNTSRQVDIKTRIASLAEEKSPKVSAAVST